MLITKDYILPTPTNAIQKLIIGWHPSPGFSNLEIVFSYKREQEVTALSEQF